MLVRLRNTRPCPSGMAHILFYQMTKRHTLTCALLCATLSATATPTTDVQALPTLTVEETNAPLLDATALDAEALAQDTAGGTSVIDLDTEFIGRVNTTADIFRFDPGVYAQAGSVIQDARLSVRGSGATRRYGNRGLTLLIDGIPANSIDGSFYTRAYNPMNTSYVQVFRGGNGLAYGGNQIGGSINFVQKTGISNPGGEAQFEYGSFETTRSYVGYGIQEGRSDAYVSASWNESDGYRSHQSWRDFNTTANYGYSWSDTAITRAYILYSDSDADLASGLTKYEAIHDPKKSNNLGAEDRDLSTFRVAQKTAVDLDHTQVELFNYYQILDLDHLTRSKRPANLIDYDTKEYGLGGRSTSNFAIADIDQTLRTSLLYSWGDNDVGGYRSVYGGGPPRSLNNDYTDGAENFQLYIENESHLTEALSLIYGIGWQHAQRDRHINSGQQDDRGSTIDKFDESYDGTTPRFAVIYALTNEWKLFANYSQSFEAPTFGESSGALDAQTASTYEVGSRIDRPRYSGELTFYYSEIEDDFIDAEIRPGGYVSENHDTLRQGIETAWTLNLLPDLSVTAPVNLFLDASYQWNDFSFDGGEYDDNQIPGIAEHVLTTRLRIEEPTGLWRIALTVERLASGLEVNNANNLESTDPFTLVNLSGDYKINEQLSLYGGVDNLFDERTINTVTINPFNAASAYSPGNGISAYLGMRLHF